MDLYFQGLAWMNKGVTPGNLVQARSFFDQALTADPNNVDALIGSARADMLEGAHFFVPDPVAAFAKAETKLTKALSLVTDHALGHMYLGFVEISTKRARASPNVNTLWCWIEISSTPIPILDSARF
jgi:hypothetical protein